MVAQGFYVERIVEITLYSIQFCLFLSQALAENSHGRKEPAWTIKWTAHRIGPFMCLLFVIGCVDSNQVFNIYTHRNGGISLTLCNAINLILILAYSSCYSIMLCNYVILRKRPPAFLSWLYVIPLGMTIVATNAITIYSMVRNEEPYTGVFGVIEASAFLYGCVCFHVSVGPLIRMLRETHTTAEGFRFQGGEMGMTKKAVKTLAVFRWAYTACTACAMGLLLAFTDAGWQAPLADPNNYDATLFVAFILTWIGINVILWFSWEKPGNGNNASAVRHSSDHRVGGAGGGGGGSRKSSRANIDDDGVHRKTTVGELHTPTTTGGTGGFSHASNNSSTTDGGGSGSHASSAAISLSIPVPDPNPSPFIIDDLPIVNNNNFHSNSASPSSSSLLSSSTPPSSENVPLLVSSSSLSSLSSASPIHRPYRFSAAAQAMDTIHEQWPHSNTASATTKSTAAAAAQEREHEQDPEPEQKTLLPPVTTGAAIVMEEMPRSSTLSTLPSSVVLDVFDDGDRRQHSDQHNSIGDDQPSQSLSPSPSPSPSLAHDEQGLSSSCSTSSSSSQPRPSIVRKLSVRTTVASSTGVHIINPTLAPLEIIEDGDDNGNINSDEVEGTTQEHQQLQQQQLPHTSEFHSLTNLDDESEADELEGEPSSTTHSQQQRSSHQKQQTKPYRRPHLESISSTTSSTSGTAPVSIASTPVGSSVASSTASSTAVSIAPSPTSATTTPLDFQLTFHGSPTSTRPNSKQSSSSQPLSQSPSPSHVRFDASMGLGY